MSNAVQYKSAKKSKKEKSKFDKKSLFLKISYAVIFIIIGFFIASAMRQTTKSTTRNITNKDFINEVVSKAGPNSQKGVLQTGFDHTEDGAVAAATSYMYAFPRMYFISPESSRIQLKKISSKKNEYADVLYLQLRKNIDDIGSKIIGNFSQSFFRAVPVGYQVSPSSADEVEVQIWSIDFWAIKDSVDPQVSSRVSVFNMIWEENDWKIKSYSNKSGPTALWLTDSTPQEVKDFVTNANQFGGFDYVPNI